MKKDIDEAKKIRKCILLAFLGISLEISTTDLTLFSPQREYLWLIGFILMIYTAIELFFMTR